MWRAALARDMDYRVTRRRVVAGGAGLATSLAGCLGLRSGGGGGSSGNTEAATTGSGRGRTATPTTDATATSPRASGPPTADHALPVSYEFARLGDEVRSGGPGKDGIPAVDDPRFESREAAADRLAEGDVVFGVVHDGVAKAYPQYVLVWHEIVNDRLGDQPVSVTYCPLTGTAMGFDRGGTTFGVSGRLLNSNLVMYDRATDSRWPQMLGTAISGAYEGESLNEFRLVWTTWGEWSRAHPDTLVLTEDTGFARRYGSDPYGQYNPVHGYYARESTLFPPLSSDGRRHPKDVVLGVRTASGGPAAFAKEALRERSVLTATLPNPVRSTPSVTPTRSSPPRPAGRTSSAGTRTTTKGSSFRSLSTGGRPSTVGGATRRPESTRTCTCVRSVTACGSNRRREGERRRKRRRSRFDGAYASSNTSSMACSCTVSMSRVTPRPGFSGISM